MSSSGHERLSELFLQASELPEEERRAFLDEQCRDHPELRRRLEAMLRTDRAVPQILDTGVVGQELLSDTEDVPERIGPYRIVGTLGEGGMGVVYEAEQEQPVQRRVALKLIKLGLETRPVLARFETERQALALMSHPNIAQVYDAGITEQGRPYFAMEYVDGPPIAEYCDNTRLPLRERLKLFVRVCEGVQHAHQKGIIHRDIKTTNVLVVTLDGRPVPKIIDFGIAKATEQPLTAHPALTQAGQMFGTPAYMSPEQAALQTQDVDTRTDVYGLGALLYELLVGAPPFDLRDTASHEIRRKIQEDDPSRPSTRFGSLGTDAAKVARRRALEPSSLARRLRGDLDWITMKALAKERDRRYASPSEFAEDIRRHMRDEPVAAGPPSTLYRSGKFVKKHRNAVSVAAVILIILAGFAVALTREARRADRAALLATEEARRSREELRHSESMTAFLFQLFDAAAPEDPDEECATVCDIVDGAIGDLSELGEDQRFLQARLMLVLGKIINDREVVAEGRAGLRRALAEMRDDPATLHFLEVAGWTTAILRRLDEAELTFERLAEVRRRRLGAEDPETLATMAELGRVFTMQGRLEKSEQVIAETLEAMRRVLGNDHPYTLRTLGFLSMVYWRQGRLEETGELLEPALADMRRVLGDGNYITLATFYNLARVEANFGTRERAFELLRLAVDGGFIYVTRDSKGNLVQGQVGMRTDKFLEPLHGDPEFESIVSRAL